MEAKQVFTVGQNAYGELALGDQHERHKFTLVEQCKSLSNVIQVAAGNEHTIILTDNGDVYSSGYNDMGQQNYQNASVGAPVQNSRPGYLKLIEKFRGKSIVKVFAYNGCEHVVGLTANGQVYSYGFNVRGQLGHGNSEQLLAPKLVEALNRKYVTTVGCSYYHTLFACEDEGTTYSCGRNDYGQLGLGGQDEDRSVPTLIEDLKGKRIVSIGCGQYHTVVATNEGNVFSFGRNDSGQLGFEASDPIVSKPTEIRNFKSTFVSSGYYHSVGISEGKLFAWGRNDSGQLGIGKSQSQKELTPKRVEHDLAGKEVVKVACGCYHTLALTSEGKLYAFGRNSHGQLGLGDETTNNHHQTKPVEVKLNLEDKKVIQIAAGFYHSVVLVRPVVKNPLIEDFRRLLNNQSMSDVTFEIEGQLLYAHTCILMARCEPLDRMLNGPMMESDGVVRIEDTTYEVFKAFLEYLYTDNVEQLNYLEVDINFALELLSLADQYLVEPLKQKCEEVVPKNIQLDDVCYMLQISMSRGANQLKKKCLEYILANFAKVIVQDAFVELDKNVLKEIFRWVAQRGVRVELDSE